MSAAPACACGKPAVWHYNPKGGDYCEECVSRGCSCNVDPNTGVEDTDELGRLLPCAEYSWTGAVEADVVPLTIDEWRHRERTEWRP